MWPDSSVNEEEPLGARRVERVWSAALSNVVSAVLVFAFIVQVCPSVAVLASGSVAVAALPKAPPRLLAPGLRERVLAEVRAAGYAHVTIDLAGYRSGSFDLALAASGTGGGDR